jgi:hypothetical protein
MANFFLLLSLIFMGSRNASTDSGLGMDPNGSPTTDLGLGMDPNG